MTSVCKWSVNGIVRGYSLTLVREWNGPWRSLTLVREWNGPWIKNENTTKIISFKIYNPGILLFLTIEFGVEPLTARMEPFFYILYM